MNNRRTGAADRRYAWRGGRRSGDRLDRPVALVVDDHADSRELIAAVLGSADIGTSEASTCQAALDRLEKPPPPRVVIVDLNLPDCHGTEVIRAVRGRPATAMMPIIVLSAAVTPNDRRTAVQAGASLFVAKPFIPDALVAAVTALLDQAAL